MISYLSLGGILNSFASPTAIKSLINVVVWGSIIGGIIIVAAIAIRNKIKYKYSGEVYKRRQDDPESNLPNAKRIEGKAGYFKERKTGEDIYRIKYGLAPWQKIELKKMPDPQHMVGNKAVFLQLQKDNLVQAKASVDWKGEKGKYQLEPVESDMKSAAEFEIMRKNQMLDTSKLKPVVVGMIVMGLIIVTGIIVFYFLAGG